MSDRPDDEAGDRRSARPRSRQEALEKWLRENVRHFDAKEKVTLFGFKVSFSWDDDDCGQFYVKFDGAACSDPFKIYYAMNGKPDFRTPICHSPLGVPASYGTVEFSREAHKAILFGLSTVLPMAEPFGLGEAGVVIKNGTPLGQRLNWSEAQAAEVKLSAPFFYLDIPIDPTT